MSAPMIRRLGIVGVGLIGGSFAAALKLAGAVGEVVGLGRTQEAIQEATRLGLIDQGGTEVSVLDGADFILLGTPVGQMPMVMQALAPRLAPGCVITDGGSTKSDVWAYAKAYLPQHLAHFVPSHPIAGAEQSGPAAARADLYHGKNIVVCPQAENDPAAVALVERAWQLTGGLVRMMEVAEHDRVFAAVSHLPHLLAFGLVDEIASRPNADVLFDFAASGFRDFTRIASSHPEMWRDICLANREALLLELEAYRAQLDRLHGMLQATDGPALETVFDHARRQRNAWLVRRGEKA